VYRVLRFGLYYVVDMISQDFRRSDQADLGSCSIPASKAIFDVLRSTPIGNGYPDYSLATLRFPVNQTWWLLPHHDSSLRVEITPLEAFIRRFRASCGVFAVLSQAYRDSEVLSVSEDPCYRLRTGRPGIRAAKGAHTDVPPALGCFARR